MRAGLGWADAGVRTYMQSEFYRGNDVKSGKAIVTNMFSTPSNDYHAMQLKPIQKLYTLNGLMEFEPLADKTITAFRLRMEERFVAPGRVRDVGDRLLFCATLALTVKGRRGALTDCPRSCVGCYRRDHLQSAYGFSGDRSRCGADPQWG